MNKIVNKIKKIIPIVIMGVLFNSGVAYANNSSIIKNEAPVLITESNTSMSINRTSNSIVNGNNIIEGDGSLDKAERYVENKLFDIVGFLQSFVKPLTYVTFIVSTIMMLFGVVTESRSKFSGFLGMAFSIFVYVAVVFAPQIVEYFSSWLAM